MIMLCDNCWYNNYDEEQDAYYCSKYFDEDEWSRLAKNGKQCPYFRSVTESGLARRNEHTA